VTRFGEKDIDDKHIIDFNEISEETDMSIKTVLPCWTGLLYNGLLLSNLSINQSWQIVFANYNTSLYYFNSSSTE